MRDQERDMHTRSDDPPIKVTREIPLPWLIAIVMGLIVQAVTIWNSVNALTVEVKELRVTTATGSLKTVEHEVQLADVLRRLAAVETRCK
jgi:hypothetical protein